MGHLHQIDSVSVTPSADLRSAARRRVLMRSAMRLQGQADEWVLTVKDLSCTGMKARSSVSLFPGTQVEISLPNIGWVPAEVVRIEGEQAIGLRFGAAIDPEQSQVPVSGS
jgi:hypothetical protein